MKPEIHPQYSEIKATCSCGNVIETRSTLGEDIHLDVCSACHPFYTGKQKILDSGGRVERFRKRFSSRTTAAKAEDAEDVAVEDVAVETVDAADAPAEG
jgi:large subunit ribosomal protein L31